MSIVQSFDAKIFERFWSKVDKTQGHGPWGDCWLWTGATNKPGRSGYGRFGYGTRKERNCVYAHRFSYMIHHGEIPEGYLVCHHCDTPLCQNPKHLFLGTTKDNMQDASKKRRCKTFYINSRGERNGRAKLTIEDVLMIQELAQNHTALQISKIVSMSLGHVRAIIRGENWKSIGLKDVRNTSKIGTTRKFTVEQADLIRQRHQNGERIAALAREFKVHRETITRIIRHRFY